MLNKYPSLSEYAALKMKLSFEKHAAEQNVSLDEHIRNCGIELGQSLEKKIPIYLDQRYWIIIRDVALGRNTKTDSIELFKLLKFLTSNGRAFCPISESVFVELLKQQDIKTRRATANIIDELSLGITLATEELRIGTELAHFFYSHGKPESIYPLNWLVWSKLSYVLGVVHPSNTIFDLAQELIIQKAFFDHMWGISLTEVVDTLGDVPIPPIDFDTVAFKLNRRNAAHSKEIRSFKQAYACEINGGLSLFVGTARIILEEMFSRATGKVPILSEEERKSHEKKLLSFFTNAFLKTDIATKLPTLHIHASCHSSVRWDKTRQLEGNDLFDFHHAAGALAYCEAFFIERPLEMLIKAKNIALDQKFDCKVFSAIPEAVDHLARLAQ